MDLGLNIFLSVLYHIPFPLQGAPLLAAPRPDSATRTTDVYLEAYAHKYLSTRGETLDTFLESGEKWIA